MSTLNFRPGDFTDVIFIAVSSNYKIFGNGKQISMNRLRIDNGLTVFFYDSESIHGEFGKFGLIEFQKIEEPVKHMPNEEPMKFWKVICWKN